MKLDLQRSVSDSPSTPAEYLVSSAFHCSFRRAIHCSSASSFGGQAAHLSARSRKSSFLFWSLTSFSRSASESTRPSLHRRLGKACLIAGVSVWAPLCALARRTTEACCKRSLRAAASSPYCSACEHPQRKLWYGLREFQFQPE